MRRNLASCCGFILFIMSTTSSDKNKELLFLSDDVVDMMKRMNPQQLALLLSYDPCECFTSLPLINRSSLSTTHSCVYRSKRLYLVRLSNCQQFSHDTINTTCMFTFTISFSFLVTTTAELYVALNSFITHSTRQRYLYSPPNLKHVDQFSVSPLFSQAH